MPRRNRRIAARAATALGLVAFLVPPGMASPAVTRAVPPEPGPALQLGPAATGDPVIAAAGDISLPPPVDPTAGSKRTSDAILAMDPAPATVLTLGDNQYGGQLSDYNGSGAFHATWGRFKSKIRPAFGDEDRTPSGSDAGYYAYFNDGNGDGPAGPNGRGYYSFDVGAWHIVVLNSETDHEAS